MATARTRKKVQVSGVEDIELIHLDIRDIKNYKYNPRDNQAAVSGVANSIKEFRFLVPVVIDKKNELIAGHTRVAAAKQLGINRIPAVRAEHLSKDQIRAFRIIDNKTAELSQWIPDLLSREISLLQDSGISLTDFGWQQEEIDCLTDVVADDCLSGASDSPDERSRHVNRRRPLTTRFVLGEFVFFIPTDSYTRWATQIRNECDFDEEAITRRLHELLQLTGYLDSTIN